jgi:hypothetical protein
VANSKRPTARFEHVLFYRTSKYLGPRFAVADNPVSRDLSPRAAQTCDAYMPNTLLWTALLTRTFSPSLLMDETN